MVGFVLFFFISGDVNSVFGDFCAFTFFPGYQIQIEISFHHSLCRVELCYEVLNGIVLLVKRIFQCLLSGVRY